MLGGGAAGVGGAAGGGQKPRRYPSPRSKVEGRATFVPDSRARLQARLTRTARRHMKADAQRSTARRKYGVSFGGETGGTHPRVKKSGGAKQAQFMEVQKGGGFRGAGRKRASQRRVRRRGKQHVVAPAKSKVIG